MVLRLWLEEPSVSLFDRLWGAYGEETPPFRMAQETRVSAPVLSSVKGYKADPAVGYAPGTKIEMVRSTGVEVKVLRAAHWLMRARLTMLPEMGKDWSILPMTKWCCGNRSHLREPVSGMRANVCVQRTH